MAEGTQDALAFGPDVRIGFLGGGQLGRMTIQAALDLDMRIEVLDPDPQCPCARIAHQFTQGDLNDAEAVIAWGRSLDVVTVEIENVSTEGLTALKAMGVKVLPDPAHLGDDPRQGDTEAVLCRAWHSDVGLRLVEDGRAESMSRGLPVVQKLRTGGYDGRGVQVIRTEEEARYAFDAPASWRMRWTSRRSSVSSWPAPLLARSRPTPWSSRCSMRSIWWTTSWPRADFGGGRG